MPKKTHGPRLYIRDQGGQRRYWVDLRSIGGKREPLIGEGERLATTDPVVAQKLFTNRLESFTADKRNLALFGLKPGKELKAYADHHLTEKALEEDVTNHTLEVAEARLQVAIDYFGEGADLKTIGVDEVRSYLRWLAQKSNGRGGTLERSTQRKYLFTLSNLFERAVSEQVVPSNPVGKLKKKPLPQKSEASWLEVWEGALLLEAARVFPYGGTPTSTAGERLSLAISRVLGDDDAAIDVFLERLRKQGRIAGRESLMAYLSGDRIPTKSYLLGAAQALGLPEDELYRGKGWNLPKRPDPQMYPLIAALLLTGGRESEVYGLRLMDVQLYRETIVFVPTEARRLKTSTSSRPVPYWPQLQEILEPHIRERRRAGATEDDLVFTSSRTGGMLNDTRKSLDAVAATAGWSPGSIRTKAFRHTYCAARLQTLDRGEPVSPYTVASELGHGGDSMVRRVYGHLGRIRHRADHVEYRIEQQHQFIPPTRLERLRDGS